MIRVGWFFLVFSRLSEAEREEMESCEAFISE
jgi:hypothetical protein